jgi:hypothetical protein
MNIRSILGTFNTAVGKAVKSVGSKSWVEHYEGHYEAEAGSKFDKLMRNSNKAAITLGEVVLYVNGGYNEVRRAHEEVHVQQAKRHGIMFFINYGLASLKAMVTGKHYYKDNQFEIEAELVEGVVRDTLNGDSAKVVAQRYGISLTRVAAIMSHHNSR